MPSHNNSKKASLELYLYGDKFLKKLLIKEPDQLTDYLNQKDHKFWLNVSSIQDLDVMHQLAKIFNIHPLLVEDILNVDQRPKIEEFEDYILICSKMIYSKNDLQDIQTEHISLLFGQNFTISFQETSDDIFDIIRSRLENPTGKMRRFGTDYFTYTLLDTIVDQYYVVLEMISDAIEKIEDDLIISGKSISLKNIYLHRKIIREVKKNAWPMREILSTWNKSENPLIKKRTQTFINDVYEHTIEILEELESQREAMTTLADIYMTHLSIRQNDVMKTLTIIATIFIPLTFIAGIYGMNFQVMPELQWQYGYLGVWLVFLLVTALMIRYFKKKKWF